MVQQIIHIGEFLLLPVELGQDFLPVLAETPALAPVILFLEDLPDGLFRTACRLELCLAQCRLFEAFRLLLIHFRIPLWHTGTPPRLWASRRRTPAGDGLDHFFPGQPVLFGGGHVILEGAVRQPLGDKSRHRHQAPVVEAQFIVGAPHFSKKDVIIVPGKIRGKTPQLIPSCSLYHLDRFFFLFHGQNLPCLQSNSAYRHNRQNPCCHVPKPLFPFHGASFYFSFPYSSGSTPSHHSLLVPSPGTSRARCWKAESGAAPCQCFTSGGMFTTSPAFSSRAGFPHSW